jgi:hypothetical protein
LAKWETVQCANPACRRWTYAPYTVAIGRKCHHCGQSFNAILPSEAPPQKTSISQPAPSLQEGLAPRTMRSSNKSAGRLARFPLVTFVMLCVFCAACGAAFTYLILGIAAFSVLGSDSNFTIRLLFPTLFMAGVVAPPAALVWIRRIGRRDQDCAQPFNVLFWSKVPPRTGRIRHPEPNSWKWANRRAVLTVCIAVAALGLVFPLGPESPKSPEASESPRRAGSPKGPEALDSPKRAENPKSREAPDSSRLQTVRGSRQFQECIGSDC